MKKIFTTVLSALTFIAIAQSTDQQQIDQQVWKPFTAAIMTHDVNSFVAVHSKDLVRAEINRKKVMGYEEYKQGMEKGWPSWKESNEKNKVKYTFELRFTDRISNGSMAYEIGYFKNETINGNGEKRVGYGKFHVVLRKENGTWKILVDSDSNEGGNITEEMFQAAKPLSN